MNYLETYLNLCAKLKVAATLFWGQIQTLIKPRKVSTTIVKLNHSCDYEYIDSKMSNNDEDKDDNNYLKVI